jgi:hypothetical protein
LELSKKSNFGLAPLRKITKELNTVEDDYSLRETGFLSERSRRSQTPFRIGKKVPVYYKGKSSKKFFSKKKSSKRLMRTTVSQKEFGGGDSQFNQTKDSFYRYKPKSHKNLLAKLFKGQNLKKTMASLKAKVKNL